MIFGDVTCNPRILWNPIRDFIWEKSVLRFLSRRKSGKKVHVQSKQANKYKQCKQQQLYWSQKKYYTCTLHRTTPTFYSKSYSRQAVWVCSTYIVLHLSELNLYYECMKFLKEIKEIREVKHHLYVKRQTRICTTWSSFPFACRLLFIISTHTIITFTQEEAIMTSRQTREKLQFLYENVISNNFRKNACSEKKNGNFKLKLHRKGFYWQIFGAVPVL